MELTIECKKRAAGDKPKAVRRSGNLPAVLYGHDGTSSVSLTVNTRDAEALLRKAVVNKTVVDVKVPDMPWKGKALLREVQTHPWKNKVYHISFFSIASQSEVEVSMPLNFTGIAKGVKDDGGVLDTVITEMQLKCPPDGIPETLDINVSDLGIGDSLHVGDLILPDGVFAVDSPELLVVSVLAGRTAEASETEEEEDNAIADVEAAAE
ncbi:MAG: 50S ribosomal protein L25/general stress protein Ctc [Cyanobacteria bacterium P01_A01_bin.114]